MSPTAKGVMIGIFSVLGAVGLLLIMVLFIYYFRYTHQGRIFLDRITRPGEYDDEQQFAKEEAEALEEMDDIQRTEYFRAKGGFEVCAGCTGQTLTHGSFHPGKSPRVRPDGYFVIAVFGNTREGRVGVGIRARARNRKLFRGGAD